MFCPHAQRALQEAAPPAELQINTPPSAVATASAWNFSYGEREHLSLSVRTATVAINLKLHFAAHFSLLCICDLHSPQISTRCNFLTLCYSFSWAPSCISFLFCRYECKLTALAKMLQAEAVTRPRSRRIGRICGVTTSDERSCPK